MKIEPNETTRYLGDGLHVQDDDGQQFILWTDRADGRHYVALDSNVLRTFIRYIEIVGGLTIRVEKMEAKV